MKKGTLLDTVLKWSSCVTLHIHEYSSNCIAICTNRQQRLDWYTVSRPSYWEVAVNCAILNRSKGIIQYCTCRADGDDNVSSPPGSGAVLHSHLTAQGPTGGAKPGPHTSRKRSRNRCSQPQLWTAAGLCPRCQVTLGKRWNLRYPLKPILHAINPPSEYLIPHKDCNHHLLQLLLFSVK